MHHVPGYAMQLLMTGALVVAIIVLSIHITLAVHLRFRSAQQARAGLNHHALQRFKHQVLKDRHMLLQRQLGITAAGMIARAILEVLGHHWILYTPLIPIFTAVVFLQLVCAVCVYRFFIRYDYSLPV